MSSSFLEEDLGVLGCLEGQTRSWEPPRKSASNCLWMWSDASEWRTGEQCGGSCGEDSVAACVLECLAVWGTRGSEG